ncbi:MAG: collagen binding domain-containing protein [Lachnospiraceae bacterium]
MKKHKRKYNEVNYWESMADNMVALLLCILLITLLLILYLLRIPDDKYVDKERGNRYEKYDDTDNDRDDYDKKFEDDDKNRKDTNEQPKQNGGGGGGGAGEEKYKYEDPDPGAGEDYGADKAAVFVQVVDGETRRTIKKQGLEFELYGSNSALQVLSTYYPEKIDYKKYRTDAAGTFYLPEKIALSSYYLHGLSTLPGYDASDNTKFTINESHDWDDPRIVTVALYPSKNVIRIRLTDRDNGEAITDAEFDVVAAENIVTRDGTTRYKVGEVVDTITVNKNGYGKSKKLYLGTYRIRQTKIPEYYAKITKDKTVEVENKTEVGVSEVTKLTEEKTSIQVTVADALYNTTYLSGAEFTLSDDEENVIKELKTDDRGRFTVKNLRKNRTYHLKQISTASDYQMDYTDYSFHVNGSGLIDGKKEADLQITNRIIRISVGVRDQLFRGQVSDVNVAIHDAAGNVIKVWNTTGLEQTVEGLAPGTYMVVLDGNKEKKLEIIVEDKTELQTYQFERWTVADIGTILGLSLIFVGAVIFVSINLKRNRKKKAENKE